MTSWDWLRFTTAALLIVTAVLFGAVNWLRRRDTDRWDAMARIGSLAYWLCAAGAVVDAHRSGLPSGPRLLPVAASLLLIVVAYTALLAREIRARRKEK